MIEAIGDDRDYMDDRSYRMIGAIGDDRDYKDNRNYRDYREL